MEAERIVEGIWMVGGPDISAPEDAAVFVVACGDEFVMIDAGAGKSAIVLEERIRECGLDPRRLATLILTHCHVDHIGAAHYFKETYGCRIVAHDLDADAIETGDPRRTAASWYGVKLPRTTVDMRLKGDQTVLRFADRQLHCLHTPGHTPGSMAIYIDIAGQRILFGQDIHGPFHIEFGSDMVSWRASMEKLIALNADILCEGHFGVYAPRERVTKYIRGYLDRYAAA